MSHFEAIELKIEALIALRELEIAKIFRPWLVKDEDFVLLESKLSELQSFIDLPYDSYSFSETTV